MLRTIGRRIALLVQNWRPIALPALRTNKPIATYNVESGYHLHFDDTVTLSSDKHIVLKSGPQSYAIWLNPRLDNFGAPIKETPRKVHVAYKNRPSTLQLKHRRHRMSCTCCKH